MKKQNQRKAVSPASKGNEAAAEPTEEAIAKRAHEIYLACGGPHGSDLDDWLQTERELKTGAKTEMTKS